MSLSRGLVELQDEAVWLRHGVLRMRVALRFTINPEVESILREFIADAEARLLVLEQPDAQATEIDIVTVPKNSE